MSRNALFFFDPYVNLESPLVRREKMKTVLCALFSLKLRKHCCILSILNKQSNKKKEVEELSKLDRFGAERQLNELLPFALFIFSTLSVWVYIYIYIYIYIYDNW